MPCFRFNPGWGPTSIWAIQPRFLYVTSMHFTKSNFQSTRNLFKVIIVWMWIEYISLSWTRKHTFAQGKLPDAKLNQSLSIQSCGTGGSGVEFVRRTRSNETRERACNLANCKCSQMPIIIAVTPLKPRGIEQQQQSTIALHLQSDKFKFLPAYFFFENMYWMIHYFVSRNFIRKWQVNLCFVCLFVCLFFPA